MYSSRKWHAFTTDPIVKYMHSRWHICGGRSLKKLKWFIQNIHVTCNCLCSFITRKQSKVNYINKWIIGYDVVSQIGRVKKKAYSARHVIMIAKSIKRFTEMSKWGINNGLIYTAKKPVIKIRIRTLRYILWLYGIYIQSSM